VTPEGCDLYARGPALDAVAARRILARVERAAGRAIGSGWFLTHREGQPDGGLALAP
jgi:hypothetical protein